MWKLVSRGGTVIGATLTLLSIAGIPDEIATWSKWIAALDSNSARWILALCGVGGLLALHGIPYAIHLLRPPLNLELKPSSGPSGDVVLIVTNCGPDMKIFAKCRPLAMRNSPNPMTDRTYDLKWEGKNDRQLDIQRGSSENLVIAAWSVNADYTLAEMWLTQFGDTGISKFNSCRWNFVGPYGSDSPPEFDIEVTIFGIGARSPNNYQYVVRMANRYGPLAIVPLRRILT